MFERTPSRHQQCKSIFLIDYLEAVVSFSPKFSLNPSLLAAVFCVGPILPPHKRLLNRAGHVIPIV